MKKRINIAFRCGLFVISALVLVCATTTKQQVCFVLAPQQQATSAELDVTRHVLLKRLANLGTDTSAVSVLVKDKQLLVSLPFLAKDTTPFWRYRAAITRCGQLRLLETLDTQEANALVVKLNGALATNADLNPLLGLLNGPMNTPNYVHRNWWIKTTDTANMRALVFSPTAKAFLPPHIDLMFLQRDGQNEFHFVSNAPTTLLRPTITKASYLYEDGTWQIRFTMDSLSAEHWLAMTTKNTRKTIAVVVDNRLLCLPMVYQPISGGDCSISGTFDEAEAAALTNLLLTPPLPFRLRIVREELVSGN